MSTLANSSESPKSYQQGLSQINKHFLRIYKEWCIILRSNYKDKNYRIPIVKRQNKNLKFLTDFICDSKIKQHFIL
jgi:hypothetical protein